MQDARESIAALRGEVRVLRRIACGAGLVAAVSLALVIANWSLGRQVRDLKVDRIEVGRLSLVDARGQERARLEVLDSLNARFFFAYRNASGRFELPSPESRPRLPVDAGHRVPWTVALESFGSRGHVSVREGDAWGYLGGNELQLTSAGTPKLTLGEWGDGSSHLIVWPDPKVRFRQEDVKAFPPLPDSVARAAHGK